MLRETFWVYVSVWLTADFQMCASSGALGAGSLFYITGVSFSLSLNLCFSLSLYLLASACSLALNQDMNKNKINKTPFVILNCHVFEF